MRQAADATRIAVGCVSKASKLLTIVVEDHGYKGKHMSSSPASKVAQTPTTCCTWTVNPPPRFWRHTESAVASDPYHAFPHWRTVWLEIKQRVACSSM